MPWGTRTRDQKIPRDFWCKNNALLSSKCHSAGSKWLSVVRRASFLGSKIGSHTRVLLHAADDRQPTGHSCIPGWEKKNTFPEASTTLGRAIVNYIGTTPGASAISCLEILIPATQAVTGYCCCKCRRHLSSVGSRWSFPYPLPTTLDNPPLSPCSSWGKRVSAFKAIVYVARPPDVHLQLLRAPT